MRGRSDGQCFGSPAQRRMVGHGEIETEQADDRPDQTFGLAQREAEHGAQGQRRRDRQGGVVRLAAGRGAPLGTPGRDRGVGEPDRQAPALAQGSVILRPIRDLVPLLRDMVPAILVRFEGHDGLPMSGGAALLTGKDLCRQPPAPCNKVVICLAKHRDAMLTFYDFPAEHWDHLRTSNPVESVFATVRHRTVRSKGASKTAR